MAHIQSRNGRYQARFRGPDGKERTQRFDRKVDAEAWLVTNGADMVRGAWVDPIAGAITLKDFANEWLNGRSDLRASTVAKYRGLLDLHIIPELGADTMANLKPAKVRRWNANLSQRHSSTAAGAYRLLSAICNTAIADEVIARSPCRVVGASEEHPAERPTASLAELSAATEAVPDKWRLALMLATWCQLRRGEILGLQRRDVDPLHGTIRVERTWTAVAGKALVGPPKTKAGRRTIAIPPNINEALEHHLSSHVDRDAGAWLFPGDNGAPTYPSSLTRVWSSARLAIGRPDLHFHDLRHSGLTWAAATGASTAELMRRAGHKSPVAALRYQHATEDRDRVLADALATLAESAPIIEFAEAADKLRTGRAGNS
ncbi:MAG TPA: site-specific integrase [Acidimicrobiales bacterium]|jgi:integrase|nr:site-specific integrase [Acidimicrobiales bacterium]